MDVTLIVLRIVHIVSGIAWVGAVALFVLYIRPTLYALGPDAEKVVNELVVRRRLRLYFAIVSTLAVLAGALLYWRISGLQLAWITRPTGLGFTLGALAALIAWPVGNIVLGRAFNRLGEVGAEMKAAGGPPGPELLARLQAARARVDRIGFLLLTLVTVAAVLMATSRYLR
jgi:hypothetical protein